MHSLYLRKMARSNSRSIYEEDKCCVNISLLTLKHATDEKKVDIYGRSDYQLRCMYAECCGYMLMSASALCIHVCFARPFGHQSVASARLSVRLVIVYHCASRFIFRLSICPSVHLSDIPSVRLYVCMFTCTYVEMNVLVYVPWTSKIELT